MNSVVYDVANRFVVTEKGGSSLLKESKHRIHLGRLDAPSHECDLLLQYSRFYIATAISYILSTTSPSAGEADSCSVQLVRHLQ